MSENKLSTLSLSASIADQTEEIDNKWQKIARIGWIILALLAVVILIGSLPGYFSRWQGQFSHSSSTENSLYVTIFAIAGGVASLAAAILSIGLAILLFIRKFSTPISIFVSFFLLVYGVVLAGPMEHLQTFIPDIHKFTYLLQSVLLATPLIALLMLFPNGKFVPSWTRWIVLLTIPWNLGVIWIAPYDAETLSRYPILTGMVAFFLFVFSSTGIYAQFYRYRHISTFSERQQTRWVVFGFTVWIFLIIVSSIPFMFIYNRAPGSPIPWWGPITELVWWLSLNILPVCLTISITKSRLWNIDFVINRTLVYSGLTFTTMAIYVLFVGIFGYILQVRNSSLVAFFATGLIAILFQPLRERLQNVVNRLMYGERDNPISVLSKLGEELEHTGSPSDTLTSITRTVATTLKIPYVAIELGEDQEPSAAYGIPKNQIIRLPMQYQNTVSGYLVVAERSQGESFQAVEIQLLENIARQAGAAAHATKLTTDLLSSRQKLVTAREEERRRIRRDLHDGLGPQLASQTLTLTAARRLLASDPEKAEQLIQEAIRYAQTSTEDLRRMVYDLRPPALDDLGLIGAMQSRAQHFESEKLELEFDLPTTLPQLPAAVEVACYMIFQEALTNVIRHAKASHCKVSLKVQAGLELRVEDNGTGIKSQHSSGVGLNSMRQRAEELGGKFQVRSSPQTGTQLTITFPIFSEEDLA